MVSIFLKINENGPPWGKWNQFSLSNLKNIFIWKKIADLGIFFLQATFVNKYFCFRFSISLKVIFVRHDVRNEMFHFQVVWFTALFPYLIIAILLVRAVTLEGAWNGILYLISTDFTKLKSAQTWIDGITQIFFGYSLGIGTLPALGSYNRFEHNSFKWVQCN